MAETSEGWDGTVDEAGIARILAAAVPGSVGGPGDFVATVTAGQRRVVLTPGESFHAFIRYADTAPRVFDFAAPTTGRWHLIVQRRDWNLNTVTTLALAGPETPVTPLPLAPPTAMPADFADSPGILADLPLWWVWVRSTDNTVVIRNARNYDYGVRGKPFGHLGMDKNVVYFLGNGIKTPPMPAVAQILLGGMQSANGRLIVPESGYYRLSSFFYWTSGNPGQWYSGYITIADIGIITGGAAGYQGTSSDITSYQSVVRYLEAGAQVYLQAQGTGGNTHTFGSNGFDGTYLEVEKL